MLQKEFDNCLDVYVSTLNYWRDKKTQVGVDIQETLMTMVKSVPSRDYHEGIVNVLKNLSGLNYKALLICLDYLFANYSSPHETHDKLENLFITRMWITISKRGNLPSSFLLKDVKGYFKLAEKTFAKSISEKTRSGITTMIWKEGSLAFKSRFYEDALAWFEIGLSRILFSIEDLTDPNNDKGKLLRMCLSSLLQLGRYSEAISKFESLDKVAKTHSLTLYYIFQCYAKLGHRELALNCIEEMKKRRDSKHLLAIAVCAIDGEMFFDKRESINIMYNLVKAVMIKEEDENGEFIRTLKQG